MPEVDLDFFLKKPALDIADHPDLFSTDAPEKPQALITQQPVVEILPPQHIFVPSEAETVRTPFQLRGIDIGKIESRLDFIRAVSVNIPENEFNLPIFIYRPDLLDCSWIGDEEWPENIVDMLQNAAVDLDYSQGFPIFQSGLPFWSRLDYESSEAYSAFTMYLELGGARGFHSIPAIPVETAREWHTLNYWGMRARAYDLFKVAHHQRMREQRVLGMNDKHYMDTEKIFNRISKVIDGKSDEELGAVDLPKLVGMLDKVARLQRLSLGLSSSNSSDGDQAPKSTSFELTMRQVAKNSGSDKKDDNDLDTQLILQDPDTIAAAQELILKVNHK